MKIRLQYKRHDGDIALLTRRTSPRVFDQALQLAALLRDTRDDLLGTLVHMVVVGAWAGLKHCDHSEYRAKGTSALTRQLVGRADFSP